MKLTTLIITALLVFPSYSTAEVSVAIGADVGDVAGEIYAEIRYFGEKYPFWSAYIATKRTIGADVYYQVDTSNGHGIQFGIGVERATPTPVVSTPAGIQLRIEYVVNDELSVGVKHRSNCKTVCDRPLIGWARIGDGSTKNAGYNALYLRMKF